MSARALFGAVFLGICLGCSGGLMDRLGARAENRIDRGIRNAFVKACVEQAVAGLEPDTQQRVCSCVADELVLSKTPAELADLVTSPTLPEVRPIIEACGRKLIR